MSRRIAVEIQVDLLDSLVLVGLWRTVKGKKPPRGGDPIRPQDMNNYLSLKQILKERAPDCIIDRDTMSSLPAEEAFETWISRDADALRTYAPDVLRGDNLSFFT